MKFLILLVRLILGAVFVFSGFVKAVDPLGSCYKFTDYFTAMGLPSLSCMSLVLAFILSALEFTTGIMLIFNLKPRWAAWMSLIFMIVFTPLTLWIAISDPVTDCGCFGDCLKISNWQTFWKNIVLLIMALFLVIKRKRMDNPLSDNVELGISGAVFAICILFQTFMLRHLPIIDCRPYKIGTNIEEKMQLPPDAKPDVIKYTFIYKNTETGETKEFDENNIPTESIWEYVDRKDEVIEKGVNLIPEIHDFTMMDRDDTQDFTERVLHIDKPVLIVVMHKLEKSNEDGCQQLQALEKYAEKNNFIILALTSSNWDVVDDFKAKYSVEFPFFHTDDITLKTIVRANPGIVKLEKGTITGKWNFRDFDFTK